MKGHELEQALRPIGENALRLLQDAKLLHEHGRYPSSVALAIASIEECGKYIAESKPKTRTKAPSRGKAKHVSKHYQLGWFYWILAMFKVLSEEFERYREWLKTQPDAQDLYAQISDMNEKDGVDFLRKYIFKSESELRAFVRERFPDKKQTDFMGMAQSGKVEKIRQSAIYCDVDHALTLRTTPAGFQEEVSKEWLEHAEAAVAYMRIRYQVLTKTT